MSFQNKIFDKKDLENISDYLREVEIALINSNPSSILPFVNFRQCSSKQDMKTNMHKHIHSTELQKYSKFKTLFGEAGIGSVHFSKCGQEYIVETKFYLGIPGVENNGLNNPLELFREVSRVLFGHNKFKEIDYRMIDKPNPFEEAAPCLVHMFLLNNRLATEARIPINSLYIGSIINLRKIKTRILKDAFLLEDITKYHEFFRILGK